MKQRIKLTKDNNIYTADPIDQPGAPMVGRGHTPLEAIVFCICQNEDMNIKISVGYCDISNGQCMEKIDKRMYEEKRK